MTIRAVVLRRALIAERRLFAWHSKFRRGTMSNQYGTTIPVSSLTSSIRRGSTYDVLLMGLHTARRLLITQIEHANREGASTVSLERDLGDNRRATRHFLAYLEGHA